MFRKTILLLFALLLLPSLLSAASTGSSLLRTVQGSDAPTSFGDYLAADGGMDTAYLYFIEVPAGQSRLVVQIFDADVGQGGSSEANAGRDRARSGFDSSCRYRVRNPSGTAVATQTFSSSGSGQDNAWYTLLDTSNPAAGHWQLEVDMSSAVTTGDDINSYGVRAHDGNSGAGGTEYNIYLDSFTNYGSQTGSASSRDYVEYPYITSGCSFSVTNFDFDDAGSFEVTSPNGLFSGSQSSLSGNDVWDDFTNVGFSDAEAGSEGAPDDAAASETGIWTLETNINVGSDSGNYGQIWIARFDQLGSNIPVSQPQPGSFRIYLPTDGGGAPVKPYLEQFITEVISGPNPPVVNQTTRVRVRVRFVNPTAYPVTFSSTNIVRSSVPGGEQWYQPRARYYGNAVPSQGTIISQPPTGGGNSSIGAISWNPGTVAANSNAYLTYEVDVFKPYSFGGNRVVVTGTPTNNGTSATYVDETGNTSQARATHTFGPLCELAVSMNTSTVLSAEFGEAEAIASPDRQSVTISWETYSEIDCSGFRVYSAAAGKSAEVVLLTVSAIAAEGSLENGASYSFLDTTPLADGEERIYFIELLDLASQAETYGPIPVKFPTSSVEEWQQF